MPSKEELLRLRGSYRVASAQQPTAVRLLYSYSKLHARGPGLNSEFYLSISRANLQSVSRAPLASPHRPSVSRLSSCRSSGHCARCGSPRRRPPAQRARPARRRRRSRSRARRPHARRDSRAVAGPRAPARRVRSANTAHTCRAAGRMSKQNPMERNPIRNFLKSKRFTFIRPNRADHCLNGAQALEKKRRTNSNSGSLSLEAAEVAVMKQRLSTWGPVGAAARRPLYSAAS